MQNCNILIYSDETYTENPVNCESAHGVLPMENNEKTPCNY